MRLKNIVRFALLGLTTGCGDAAEVPIDTPAEFRSGDAAPSVSDEAPLATEAAQPELPRDEAAIILVDPALAEHPEGFRPGMSRAAPFWDQRPPAERITVSP